MAGKSGDTSERGKKGTKRAPKRSDNPPNGAKASSSAQQPEAETQTSSNTNTRVVNGSLEYQHTNGWIPAVYHDDIRANLIAEGPQGTYDVPRKEGKGPNNVTSFHPAYRTNGPDRHNRHKILFRYEQTDFPVPSYAPGTWMYGGRIVLDNEHNPIRLWKEIPLVLSSAYEGYDMEVVRRLNPNITFQDFRARMPRFITIGTTRKDALGKSTLSMRNSRFRLGACCLAWDDRQGSANIKAYIDELLADIDLANNSTEGFRDLTPAEVELAKAANKGNHLNRAGQRALPKDIRQERNEAEKKRVDKLKAEHTDAIGTEPLPAISNPAEEDGSRKHKREESSSDEEKDTRPAKRQTRNRRENLGPPKKTEKRKRGHGPSNAEEEEENTRGAKRQERADNNGQPPLAEEQLEEGEEPWREGEEQSGEVEEPLGEPERYLTDKLLGTKEERKGRKGTLLDQLRGAFGLKGANNAGAGNAQQKELAARPDQASGAKTSVADSEESNSDASKPDDGHSGNGRSNTSKLPKSSKGSNNEFDFDVPNEPNDVGDSNKKAGQTGLPRDPSSPSSSSLDDDSDDSDDASEASEDDTDYRYVRPRGGLEQVMIQHPLVWAREDFWDYIDEYMRIDTSLELSYIEQFQEMQALFNSEWARRGIPGKAPFLKCFAAWTGDLGDWKATRLEEQ